MEIERNFYFPDAQLSIEEEGGEVIITTNKFARCIELKGDKDGDEFGFFFEDNYFDLLPFERRRIKIKTKKEKYKVTAKAYYSSKSVSIRMK